MSSLHGAIKRLFREDYLYLYMCTRYMWYLNPQFVCPWQSDEPFWFTDSLMSHSDVYLNYELSAWGDKEAL